MGEMIDEAFLAAKSPDERTQIVLDLMDKVDEVLIDVSHPLKVLITMRVAASYSIANQVGVEDFGQAASKVFEDTKADIELFIKSTLPAEKQAEP
jgi:hypothetical protein